MSLHMRKDDFDRAVKSIVDQEFRDVMEMGLLIQEDITPAAQGMVSAIHKDFPNMTAQETEYHLRMLREECRKTADKIIKKAEETGWLDLRRSMKAKEEPKDFCKLEPPQEV